MEDENGLELSLGLPYGGSSAKSKIKGSTSDLTADEGSCSGLLGRNLNVSDLSLKNFFQMATKMGDHDGKQKSGQNSCQSETFLTDSGKCSAPVADGSNDTPTNLSQFYRYQDSLISNGKITDSGEENLVLNKRKLPFEDLALKKKLDLAADYVYAHCTSTSGIKSMRNSHVSVTTEDESLGENEDIAESKVEGPNSLLVLQHEDNSRFSVIPKYTDKNVVADPSGIDSQRKKILISGNKSNLKNGEVAYRTSLSLQPSTVVTEPYPTPSTVSNVVPAPNTAGVLSFGYSTVQLPTLETNSSGSLSSLLPSISFASRAGGDGAPNSEHSGSDTKILNAFTEAPVNFLAVAYDQRGSSNLVTDNGKHFEKAGTSASPTGNEDDENNTIFKSKEEINRPLVQGFPHKGSILQPGIASDLEFGGCGSYPDLPWVSTTGPGPNGKTISGVTYKYSKNYIKIVCACHGSHMSPEDFVQHASADVPNLITATSST